MCFAAAGCSCCDPRCPLACVFEPRGSILAEYGVAVATVAMILVPIYLHFWEFAPFWQTTYSHQHDLFHLLVYHLLPSVWINSNLLLHYFLACTVKPDEPSARETTSRFVCVCACCVCACACVCVLVFCFCYFCLNLQSLLPLQEM